MSQHVMKAYISGTRNGIDWPKPGEPAPADLTERELRQYVTSGLVKVVDDEPVVEAATVSTPVEAATVPATPPEPTTPPEPVIEPESVKAEAPKGRQRRSAAAAAEPKAD